MDSIHLYPIFKTKGLKVLECPALKDLAVGDLCLPVFPRFELYLALQIDVPGGKKAVVQVGVHGPRGYRKLRMIGDYLIRGLPLTDQRSDDLVDLPQFFLGDVDAGPGACQDFPVFSVGKAGVVLILAGNGTAAELFITAVADMRCPVQPGAFFEDKIPACLVTGGTGSAFDAADDDLTADVRLFAVIAVYAEVMRIVEGAFMVPVGKPVVFDFPGYRGRILAQIAGDLLEGTSFVQRVFNEDPVFECQMFLVTGYKSAHICFLPLLSEGDMNIPPKEEGFQQYEPCAFSPTPAANSQTRA